MKLNEINDPVKEFLEKNGIENYTLNPDGTIDVDENVRISTKQSKLPVKFGSVTGYFECGYCQLTSLEGVPSYVGHYFYCDNNKLTSLEGAPSYVGGFFSCEDIQLASLHDVHKIIKTINGDFYCGNNPIKDSVLGIFFIKGLKGVLLDNKKVSKIINKHLGQGRSGVIGAQQELLDAGLDEYARL